MDRDAKKPIGDNGNDMALNSGGEETMSLEGPHRLRAIQGNLAWREERWLVAGLALGLCASELVYGRLLDFQDFPIPVDQVVSALLLLFLLYLLATYLLLRFSEASHSSLLGVAVVVFAAAAIFRLTIAPWNPVLSDDLYRYRWEGRIQVAGENPYQLAPGDAGATGYRDLTDERIPVRDRPGGYGPLMMLTERMGFTAVARWTDDPLAQARGMKWPAAVADLAICGLLAGWLRRRGKPVLLAGIYALCPLPVVEFWGMGHNDALAIACLVGALWAMDARREGLAFGSLGAAVAFKWWPALLVPVFLGRVWEHPRRLLWAAAGMAVTPLAFVPYWSDVSENLRFLGGFAGGWRNNDSLFGVTYAMAGGDFETAKHITLALIAGLAVGAGLAFRRREVGALVVLSGTLLLSANCHPWYLTWFLPLLAFVPWPPLLVWIALSPLFYEVLIPYQYLGVWEGSRPSRWLVYVPVFGLALGYLGRWVRSRRRRGRDQAPVGS